MKRHHFALIPLFSVVLGLAAIPAAAQTSGPKIDMAALWLSGQELGVEDSAGRVDPEDYPDREMRVEVWHDKDDDETYSRGEEFSAYFRTNADLYVVVYRIDADGIAEVLWPTSRFDDGFVYGEHAYVIPAQKNGPRLRVSNSKGVEYLQAIASRYPFDLRNLGMDFTFARTDNDERYRYKVAGDPFLAVNDINYAITGLEEDVDYLVTDWSHIYIESKVEYARYTCTQCHTEEDDYHPYVDTCSTVNVYYDYGWHNRWYSRFGWYPLYYDPPYYYYDYVSYRPYWFSYYPVNYSWAWCNIYTRPYSVYGWHDSPYYAGDYGVRYRRGYGTRPLYDVASPSTNLRLRDRDLRGRGPASIARTNRRGDRDAIRRVDETQLVRNGVDRDLRTVSRDRNRGGDRGRDIARVEGRGDRRGGVQRDTERRRDRTIVSQKPLDPSRTPTRISDQPRRGVSKPGVSKPGVAKPADRTRDDRGNGRKWTRPVVRNGDRDTNNGRDRSGTVERRSPRDRGRTVVSPPSKPRQGQQKPSVDRSKPRQGQQKPSVDRSKPRQGQKKPAVDRSKPRKGQKKPAVDRSKPRKKGNDAPNVSRSTSRQGRSKPAVAPSKPRGNKTSSRGGGNVRARSSDKRRSAPAKPSSRSSVSKKSGSKSRSSATVKRGGTTSRKSSPARSSSRGGSRRSGGSKKGRG